MGLFDMFKRRKAEQNESINSSDAPLSIGTTILKQLRLEDLSDIRYSFWMGEHPHQPYAKDVLLIRFEGTYRHGASGTPDAEFMVVMGKAAISAFDPDAVIVDLSKVNYQWGDDMICVMDMGDNCDLPSAVVVGNQCRVAIGTLCFGEKSTNDPCERESIFDSLTDAWSYVAKRLGD